MEFHGKILIGCRNGKLRLSGRGLAATIARSAYLVADWMALCQANQNLSMEFYGIIGVFKARFLQLNSFLFYFREKYQLSSTNSRQDVYAILDAEHAAAAWSSMVATRSSSVVVWWKRWWVSSAATTRSSVLEEDGSQVRKSNGGKEGRQHGAREEGRGKEGRDLLQLQREGPLCSSVSEKTQATSTSGMYIHVL